ncbi:MAG: HDIG domain-containing metalloprotein [Bacteroidota bacterium]
MRRFLRVLFQRRLKNRRFVGRYGIIIAYLILMTLLMPKGGFLLNYPSEVGKKWQQEDLKANFAFAIRKSSDTLELQKSLFANQVAPIYVYDSVAMQESIRDVFAKIEQAASRLTRYKEAVQAGDSSRIQTLKSRIFREEMSLLDPSIIQRNVSTTWTNNLKGKAQEKINQVYTRGYVDVISASQKNRFLSIRKAAGEEFYYPAKDFIKNEDELRLYFQRLDVESGWEESEFVYNLLINYLKPNLVYDGKATQEARLAKSELVSPIKEKVQADQTIIRKGEIVTLESKEKIDSYIQELRSRSAQRSRWLTLFSQFMIILLTTGLLLAYLSYNRPRLFFDNKKIALVLSTLLFAVAAMIVATKLTDVAVRLSEILGPNINLSYIYLAPACIVPIFISSFFDHRLAFQANILVAVYGAVLVQQGVEFGFVQIIAGTVAVYSLRHLRTRDTFFYTLGFIFLAYTLSYISFHLLSKGSFAAINYNTLLLFVVNVVLTVIGYNLIYVLEKIFGVTSDLTYLELLDTNHPLLQELARKAPGTFQHSLQVANIAEATIQEVGGNTLLTHVGALYHDIGKMANARYFIENMSEEDKIKNPHSTINCDQSAEIIIGHVKAGMELAQKYHLPAEIIRFIETHHGTTRVEYFYRQYLKENQCQEPTAEDLFRYPGPLPFSKETAVLMMSDSIEAACRSLTNPQPEKLKELIDSIIDHKIKDQQLENSNLTFKDISIIRRSLKKQIMSIYHARIEYPEEEKVGV